LVGLVLVLVLVEEEEGVVVVVVCFLRDEGGLRKGQRCVVELLLALWRLIDFEDFDVVVMLLLLLVLGLR
jgi:hypothetical protein